MFTLAVAAGYLLKDSLSSFSPIVGQTIEQLSPVASIKKTEPTSLVSIGNAKPLAVSESGAKPIVPNFFTVATEDYPLSRRLFLYSEAQPTNFHVLDFIEFVHSFDGQEVVKEVGLVDMNIKALYAQKPDVDQVSRPEQIAPYLKVVEHAQRLSLNFRFISGTSTLDNRSLRDLDRIANYLKDKLDHQIILAGFADNSGKYEQNLVLAGERAAAVNEKLHSRGIIVRQILSCGEELPVASNSTDTGRQKNRRVEVWLN